MHNKLILFDIDGTLVWTRGAGRESTRLAMEATFGTAGAIDKHIFSGKTDWQTLTELLTPEPYSPQHIDQIIADYAVTMGRTLAGIIDRYPVQPCTGGVEAVRYLHDHPDIALGIVTGNVEPAAFVKLEAAGYPREWFPIGAYGHERFHRNDLPTLAIQRANMHYNTFFSPDDVIIVGDTVMDIACARAAGTQCAIVLTGYDDRALLEAAKPDAIFDDLSGFLAWL
ncbi:MAG: HAD hydrolase-like protein [Pleurocapsa minor GSE-CHR-MK-17-07R]|jgi:phosphoglycolate phosphatase-like HAD superfamily hydrolase|nr:HAD hydrolase-like protein [Pleurocapsa minor GSE-CHR-MK 17-07R]